MPSRALIAGIAAALLALPHPVWAGESADVEELKREVRQLQSQLQSLRTAIAEAAEMDRQRAAILDPRAQEPGHHLFGFGGAA